jgi:alkylation response protein AidB-like acyl-CoA dehydrogenase
MNPFHPFTEEHEMLRESVRKFVETELIPHADEWEKKRLCPRHVFERMGELGFIGVSYPTDVGGSGMDFWSAVVVSSELAYCNMGGLAMSLYAHTYLPLPLINAIGTKEQKEKYLKPALQGKKIAALGLTEPNVGSDLGNITTKAEDKGDHFLVNGAKMWITNGTIADFIVLLVRTGEGYNLSLLIFDTDTPGFQKIKVENKLGMHTSDTGQLFFENCKVPKENLLGELNMGFYYVMNNIQEERLIAAVMGVYGAEWALEKAKQYARERQAFGKPINKFQVIRHKIAQMAIKVETCRSIAFRAVHEYLEKGPEAIGIITMAKAYVSETSQEVIHEALQVHGGWGYHEDYGVARAWRDNRLMSIGAGTTEIMYEIISKLVVDEVSHRNKQLIKARNVQSAHT